MPSDSSTRVAYGRFESVSKAVPCCYHFTRSLWAVQPSAGMPPAVRHGSDCRPHAPPWAARRGLAGRESPRRDLLPYPRHRHLPPPQALSQSNIDPHKRTRCDG
ncbi:unnamed protein product [Coccothraustes coccothraustes]